MRRRWAVLLIALPSAVWLWAAWKGASVGDMSRAERMVATAFALAAQLLLAAIVSTVMAVIRSRHKPGAAR